MRAHAIRDYESVLQVLSEPGCPVCAFLRNVQAKLLQEGEIEEFVALCNSQAWALAAVRDSAAVAPIFHALIRQSTQPEHREWRGISSRPAAAAHRG
ncbi:MAG: hypothetical protein WBW33_04205 [Bryobacteraceae bacterium]